MACKEKAFCDVGGEEAQVAQRSCGCTISGSVQGHVGWSLERPGIVKGVSAHGGGLKLDGL